MDSIAAENLRTMKDIYARYAQGDLDAIYAALDDKVVWETEGAEMAWSGRFDRAGVPSYFARAFEVLEVLDYQVKTLLAQEDWVIGMVELRARFRASGKEESFRKLDTLRLRDGKIIEFREYYDTARVKAYCDGC